MSLVYELVYQSIYVYRTHSSLAELALVSPGPSSSYEQGQAYAFKSFRLAARWNG